ncbi:HI0074 family nucleotidyltransferase substrate-binding subunit [Sporosarcina limicola]|uniref:Nucleotidyltransferase substrate binding protein (TIGR01987 family) n=1 Tax=Sporosarcina limicola TaxID=34101 RepID=A0A927MGW9_9BACL|nr:HI0074 family nucleotidyltransferase substrate-binding subunit [Sporosarcina limicola]MBE1553663.1 nucleotidyltransferase substrate binding protein (TIGR01987 family) [Sporosarcina limicola]
MERLHERIKSAKKVLDALGQLVVLEQPNDVERDASIQRFEFTFEACWKAAKQYLFDVEGIDVGSPKGVIRSCRETNLFDDEETILALQMANDRNLTVHTYNEELAIKIHSNIKSYFPLLANWIGRIERKV